MLESNVNTVLVWVTENFQKFCFQSVDYPYGITGDPYHESVAASASVSFWKLVILSLILRWNVGAADIQQKYTSFHMNAGIVTQRNGSTYALLYFKRTRIHQRHLIDARTYWSGRCTIEIPLDGFEKQGNNSRYNESEGGRRRWWKEILFRIIPGQLNFSRRKR